MIVFKLLGRHNRNANRQCTAAACDNMLWITSFLKCVSKHSNLLTLWLHNIFCHDLVNIHNGSWMSHAKDAATTQNQTFESVDVLCTRSWNDVALRHVSWYLLQVNKQRRYIATTSHLWDLIRLVLPVLIYNMIFYNRLVRVVLHTHRFVVTLELECITHAVRIRWRLILYLTHADHFQTLQPTWIHGNKFVEVCDLGIDIVSGGITVRRELLAADKRNVCDSDTLLVLTIWPQPSAVFRVEPGNI